MPKRSRTYRKRPRSAKRRRRSYRRRRNTALSVQRQPGFANQQIVYMRYVTNISIDAAVAATGSHEFRANSIFDPDVTGVGHQPMGRDEWSVAYDHYTVLGASIKCTFLSQGTGIDTSSFLGGILLDDDSTAITNPAALMEQGKARYKLITNNSASKSYAIVRHYYNPRKFFGVKDMKDNRDMLGAQFAANPTENVHFRVFVAPFDNSADLADQEVLVQITYKVLLTEPKNLLQS